MKSFKCAAALLLLVVGVANAQQIPPQAVVTPLMTKALADYPGKEALVLTVVYPPGAVDPVHRHNAHAFVYVLEGSIVMGVRGGKAVTLTPGQTFYEGQRRAYHWAQRQSDEARQVPGRPVEEPGRAR
jgi:quercetin dioxygenase-like cupin family protein